MFFNGSDPSEDHAYSFGQGILDCRFFSITKICKVFSG